MRTIVITHKQCTTHITSKEHPEQPARIKAITTALRERLAKEASVPADSQEAAGIACMFAPIDPVAIDAACVQARIPSREQSRRPPFDMLEMESSQAMLAMLEAQLTSLTDETAAHTGLPALRRSESVDYMQLRVLPAVRAVHTQRYLDKLRAACEELAARPKPKARRPPVLMRNISGISGDTYASRNSLSAALCGVLAACRGIDAVVSGGAANAFCVSKPIGTQTAGPLHTLTCMD